MSRMILKLGLLLGSLTIAVVGAEVLIRIVEPEEDTKAFPMPESERLYGYAPRSEGCAGGVRFSTNSWGFRGPEWVPTAEDGWVIVALGDSYTFGYGVDFVDAYPSVLENLLNLRNPARPVRVINLGIPGYDTAQEIATLREVGPRVHPDVVLLGYVLNDIYRRDDGTEFRKRGLLGPLYSIRDDIHLFKLLLPQAARLARTVGLEVKTTATQEVEDYVGNGATWRRNQAALMELRELCRHLDAELAVIVLPYFVQFKSRHPALHAYETVVEFFQYNDVPVVNAYDYFAGSRAQGYWINAFDGHPNADGHLVLAKAAEDLVWGLID